MSRSDSISDLRRMALRHAMSLALCPLLCAIAVDAWAEEYVKSGVEKALEVHEKKSRTGVKIAPPPGGPSGRDETRAVDELMRSVPEDSGEVSLPASYLDLGGAPQTPEEIERRRLEQRRREFNLRGVDEELSGGRKALDERHTRELSDIERKLGVESRDEDVGKAPSFTLGIQNVKNLFKAREYEEALIVLSDLLRHYPKSPQLLLMKGTLHHRLGQIDIALSAYQRAFEIEPSRRLKAQIDSLKRMQADRESLRPRREGVVIPLGIEDAQFVRPRQPALPATSPTTRTAPPAATPPSAPAAPASGAQPPPPPVPFAGGANP